jgi:flagellin
MVEQIANNTQYGSRNLLDGTAGTKTTVVNQGDIASASLTLGGETAGYVEVTVDTAAEKAVLASQFNTAGAAITGAGQAVSASVNAINVGEWAVGEDADLIIDGINVGTFDDTATWTDVLTAINTNTAIDVTAEIDADNNNEFTVSSNSYGSAEHLSIEWDVGGDTINLEGALSGTADVKFGADTGVDVLGHAHFNGGAQVDFIAGTGLTLTNATYGSIVIDEDANSAQTLTDAIYVEEGQLSFQIGVNENQIADMEISDCRATALGTGVNATYTSLSLIDVSTVDGGTAALSVIDAAINEISTLRGSMGAFQVNELEAQTRSLAIARENLAASESSIRDTDFGREIAEFTTAQILVQSATAFLVQANSLPQNVLSLIQG